MWAVEDEEVVDRKELRLQGIGKLTCTITEKIQLNFKRYV